MDNSRVNSSLSSAKNSYIVGACILVSRISGLVREVLLAYFLGTSFYSDAFKAALRIPNFLQNMFGEGVLSASFIPVYSRLKASNSNLSQIVAKQTGLYLGITAFILAVLGIFFSDILVSIFTPGFDLKAQELTSKILKIIFPGIAILVLSSWCLGILNSHRSFLLPYAAPLAWNGSIIAGLLYYIIFDISFNLYDLTIFISFLVLTGSILQFLVQIPKTMSLIKSDSSKTSFTPVRKETKEVFKGFIPVSLGRGVVQISAYIDTIVASLLVQGSLSILMYAQSIFLLPVSVFGMAISAAELPELSEKNSRESLSEFHQRLTNAQTRIMFFVLPTALIFIFFSYSIISLVFRAGAFDEKSTLLVSYTLTCLGFALIPTTQSRLLSSSLYALSEHKNVSIISVLRIVVGTSLGALLSLMILPESSLPPSLYIIGIVIGSALGAWLEFFLLRKKLKSKINSHITLFGSSNDILKLLCIVIISLLTAYLMNIYISIPEILKHLMSLLTFAVMYLSLSYFLLKDFIKNNLLK